MTHTFRRLDGLPPYVFATIRDLTLELRRAGEDVVDLGFGNPDLPSPEVAVAKLQEIYNQNAPGVPLFPGPQWGEYVTLRFENFPNEENPYSILSTWDTQERLIVMTTITPRAAE